jgi:hypothetical protein
LPLPTTRQLADDRFKIVEDADHFSRERRDAEVTNQYRKQKEQAER